MADPTCGDSAPESDDGGENELLREEIAAFERHQLDGDLSQIVEAIADGPLDWPDGLMEPFRFPDADEAAEYFDSAEQASRIEVDVEHAGLEGTIVGEDGYSWWIYIERPVVGVPIDQAVEVPRGIYIDDPGGQQIRAEVIGLFEDHSKVYGPASELMERLPEAKASKKEGAGNAVRKLIHAEREANRDVALEGDEA